MSKVKFGAFIALDTEDLSQGANHIQNTLKYLNNLPKAFESIARAFSRLYPGIIWMDSTGLGDPIFDDLKRSARAEIQVLCISHMNNQTLSSCTNLDMHNLRYSCV